MNLPGVVSDRFFALASQGNSDELVHMSTFIKLMLAFYGSNLDRKMKIVFQMFDFDCDGIICPEDVKMVLNYIPNCMQSADAQLELSTYSTSCSSSQSLD